MTDKTFTKEIYDQILKAVEALPKEAIESTKKEETRKGYDTTGYQYQFLVNVLNETVTPAGWSFEWTTVKEIEGAYKSGQKFYEIAVSTEIDILDATRVCVGGHISSSYADALKGAITNSLKKTLGLFGVGKKAYEGMLDDDYKPLPEPHTEVAKTVSKPVAKPVEATAPCDNVSCKGFAKIKYGKLCYTCNQHVKKGGTIAKLRSEGAVSEEEVPMSEIPF